VLVRASGAARNVPLRLAGIEARFGVPCQVAELGLPKRTETLTAIICLSREPGIEAYYAAVAETLVSVLGATPSTHQVVEAVQRLVDLFQKLRSAPKRSLSGIVGELTVISMARDKAGAISSWRADPDERFDFIAGSLRLDAKASGDRRRSHAISFEQANPPAGTLGLLASIWVEAANGGTSLDEHVAAIETQLGGDHTSILRLRTVIADTLGDTLLTGLDWRFDRALAVSSLTFFDARTIPAIRPPLPPGVSGAHFVSDFGAVPPVNVRAFAGQLAGQEAGLLPP
jgi:hypothetical protein